MFIRFHNDVILSITDSASLKTSFNAIRFFFFALLLFVTETGRERFFKVLGIYQVLSNVDKT